MILIGFADELDALAHRALKLPLHSSNPETKFIARQELAHALVSLAGRLRATARTDAGLTDNAIRPIKPIRKPIVPGVVSGPKNNVVKVEFRARKVLKEPRG